jgi:Glycosyl hydrolase family 12
MKSRLLSAVILTALLIPQASSRAECLGFEEWTIAGKPGYIVSSNVWNPSRDGAQCMFRGRWAGLPLGDGRGPALVSWAWNWPGTAKVPHGYPSIIRGWNPWRRGATSSDFPVRADALKALPASYKTEVRGEGMFNTAFEMWLSSEPRPSPANIAAEVMVWVDRGKAMPAGRKIAETSIDGRAFEVWAAKVETWDYVAYRQKRALYDGTVDLKKFLDDAKARGILQGGYWLDSVEFGNEVTQGSGRAVIDQFDLGLILLR